VELGCFFESRGTAGAKSAAQTIPGGFPVNYPYTWLRLRRSGDIFTGFASLDGQSWIQLGTATISLPSQLYVGLAVSSQNATQPSTAKFRDYGTTTSTTARFQARPRAPRSVSRRLAWSYPK
jgi:hypothetical protein